MTHAEKIREYCDWTVSRDPETLARGLLAALDMRDSKVFYSGMSRCVRVSDLAEVIFTAMGLEDKSE